MIRLQTLLFRWQNHMLPRALGSASKSSVVDVKPAESGSAAKPRSVLEESNKLSAKPKSKLVKEAFEQLTDAKSAKPVSGVVSPPTVSYLERTIKNAQNVEQLLQIAATPNLSRKSALIILSAFGDWTAEKKIKLSDFETDGRYLKMCAILSRGNGVLGDLATVLGVTGDDDAAKLISSLSLNQMIRILQKLSSGKKRSPPLLRSLAFNISKSDEKLNIKQCADVLFAMAHLSFHDEVLLLKTCTDACSEVNSTTKSSVVGSVARSLGILRCRDTALLDRIAQWVETASSPPRPQDVIAVLMALASVNYLPADADSFFQKGVGEIKPLDLTSSSLYLDAVWSLVLLDKVNHQQLALVLSSEFIDKIQKEDGSSLKISTLLKLLNIDAAAQDLAKDYQGPRLKPELKSGLTLARSRDKITLTNCVMESLHNLLPGDNFLKRDIDSQAGFLIDGECLVDKNCTPLPLNSSGKTASRVAIMVLAYHDTCVGARFHENGVQAFSRRLLEARGYKVLSVFHSEFSPSSKLVQRVQYLEQKLKALVSS